MNSSSSSNRSTVIQKSAIKNGEKNMKSEISLYFHVKQNKTPKTISV